MVNVVEYSGVEGMECGAGSGGVLVRGKFDFQEKISTPTQNTFTSC